MKCPYCQSVIKNNKVALSVIAEFGGVTNMSTMTGIPKQTIYRWTYPKNVNKGTGFVIPVKYHNLIMRAANEYRIDIEKADLIA